MTKEELQERYNGIEKEDNKDIVQNFKERRRAFLTQKEP